MINVGWRGAKSASDSVVGLVDRLSRGRSRSETEIRVLATIQDTKRSRVMCLKFLSRTPFSYETDFDLKFNVKFELQDKQGVTDASLVVKCPTI